MNDIYKRQVALLIRIMPLVYRIKDFAVHGGTAINVKDGFMLCLLGSDKPIIESLQPNSIDQTYALENQFNGMTDIEFSYADYEDARTKLITLINAALTETDKEFIISFEDGTPDWSKCSAGNLSNYPSVQWKLQNIIKLKETNPQKHKQGVELLIQYFGITIET